MLATQKHNTWMYVHRNVSSDGFVALFISFFNPIHNHKHATKFFWVILTSNATLTNSSFLRNNKKKIKKTSYLGWQIKLKVTSLLLMVFHSESVNKLTYRNILNAARNANGCFSIKNILIQNILMSILRFFSSCEGRSCKNTSEEAAHSTHQLCHLWRRWPTPGAAAKKPYLLCFKKNSIFGWNGVAMCFNGSVGWTFPFPSGRHPPGLGSINSLPFALYRKSISAVDSQADYR